jgi:hypothetical protein
MDHFVLVDLMIAHEDLGEPNQILLLIVYELLSIPLTVRFVSLYMLGEVFTSC